jgi:preprotein translocase subunit SecG
MLTSLHALSFFRSRVCQTCDLVGSVGDCGCDFDTVNQATILHFFPLLTDLAQRTFFRYFKVNLNKDCPFWHEDMMCSIRDCAVLECEAHEIPPVWIERDAEGRAVRECLKESDTTTDKMEMHLGAVDRKEAMVGVDAFAGWEEGDNARVWIEQEEEDQGMTYINLLRNPERFTGYAGPSARRAWNAIYENCFELSPGELEAGGHCLEKRVFYRLIAGLQSSISTHLALEYYDKAQDCWFPNTALFVEKVGKHPERIHNLYFTYLFLLRAINKAGPELLLYDYDTGNPEDDEWVRSAVQNLVRTSSNTSTADQCHRAFDESGMFQPRGLTDGAEAAAEEERELHKLRQDFFVRFHNISRIMDCVGCEKCRLWGKLQILGLGTAIKIVLGRPEDRTLEGRLSFQGNEVISLINTAHQLAKSVKAVENFQKLEFDDILQRWMWMSGLAFIVIGLFLRVCLQRQEMKKPSKENKQGDRSNGRRDVGSRFTSSKKTN